MRKGLQRQRDQRPNVVPVSPQDREQDFWVVEHIRRQDAHEERFDDREVVAKLHNSDQSLTQKIVARAHHLAESRQVLSAMQSTQGALSSLRWIILGLAVLTGFSLVNSALMFSHPNINVLGLLAAVLFVNFIMLILWGISMVWRPSWQGGIAGRVLALFSWMQKTFRPEKSKEKSNKQRESTLQSWLAVQQQAGLLQLWLSRWTHLFWLTTLIVAATHISFRFAFEGYQLVWSTTILSDDSVFLFLALFTWATELLGIPSPTLIDTHQAGQSYSYILSPRSTGLWILSVIILFGVIPRLILWLMTQKLYQRRQRRMQLDFTQPGLAQLIPRLQPQQSDVVDPEPETMVVPKCQRPAVIGKDYLVFTLDYEPVPEWNDVFLLEDRGVVASQAQRETLLQALAAKPARKVLVRIDTQITPDRGSLRYLAKLQPHCNQLAVWCVGHGKYQTQWQELLAEQHISGFTFPDEAIRWLRDEDIDHG